MDLSGLCFLFYRDAYVHTHTERETSQGRFVPAICESQITNLELQKLIVFQSQGILFLPLCLLSFFFFFFYTVCTS